MAQEKDSSKLDRLQGVLVPSMMKSACFLNKGYNRSYKY